MLAVETFSPWRKRPKEKTISGLLRWISIERPISRGWSTNRGRTGAPRVERSSKTVPGTELKEAGRWVAGRGTKTTMPPAAMVSARAVAGAGSPGFSRENVMVLALPGAWSVPCSTR